MTFANTTIICLLGHGDDVVDDDVPRIAHHSSYVDPNANLCKGIGTTGYCGPSENECIARGTFDIQNTQTLCVSVTPDLHVGSGKSSNIKNTVGHPQYRPHYRTQKKSSSTHMFFFCSVFECINHLAHGCSPHYLFVLPCRSIESSATSTIWLCFSQIYVYNPTEIQRNLACILKRRRTERVCVCPKQQTYRHPMSSTSTIHIQYLTYYCIQRSVTQRRCGENKHT